MLLNRKLWVPDAKFQKSTHSEKPKAIPLDIYDERFFAKRNGKSMVFYYASSVLVRTRCNMKFDDFPFDTQSCKVFLRSLRNPEDILWQVDEFSWMEDNFQDAEFDCSVDNVSMGAKPAVGKLSLYKINI